MIVSRVLVFALAGAGCLPMVAQGHGPGPQQQAADVCKRVLAAAPPAPVDVGSYAAGCDASAFYFGIGRPVDFVAARQCAYAERAHPSSTNSDIFAGPGVLSMVYANGEGTPRDTALARRFVCENQWAAPAEITGRLDMLQTIDHAAKPPHFDLCDTATSGLSEGWCQSIASRKSDVTRGGKVADLTRGLSPAGMRAFQALEQAESAFEKLRADHETDLSGTGRAAFAQQTADETANQFLADLRSLRQPAPPLKTSAAQADAALNAAYARLRKLLPAKESDAFSDYGTMNFAGVQESERAWLTLRDRWMNFVATAYPEYPRDAFLARLTRERTAQLQSIAE